VGAMSKGVATVFQFFVAEFLDFNFEGVNLFDDGQDEFDVFFGRVKKLS
jgi:hypothetical protein